MPYKTIEVRKLNPVIGAEISGVDLSKELDSQQFKELHEALMENLVIFFRNQNLTVEQHKAFGRRFGKLHVHPNAAQELAGHPEILVIKADENSKHVAGEEWHSDVSCDEEPPMGSVLHMHTVPPDGGGDTMFANMYAAFEALSPPLQRMLEGLTAVHDAARRTATGSRQAIAATGASRRASPNSGRTRARRFWRCCTDIARRRSSCAGSVGSRTRWRSGITAQRSTTHSSIIFRTAAMAFA